MKLDRLLKNIKTQFEITNQAKPLDKIEISNINIDSRLVGKKSIFFAMPGINQNGDKFIEDAIKNGACLIITKDGCQVKSDIIHIKCQKIYDFLVEILQKFYSPLPENLYAITGTNGKTSVAEFTRQMLEFIGKKSASIGTLGVNCDKNIKIKLTNSALTTPDIASFYQNLAILKTNNINDVAVETSSIGLEQKRISGLNFKVGAFTNFSQDHLDYHKNMENYFNCKMLLFNSVLKAKNHAVLNSDIAEFSKIKEICQKNNLKIVEYGQKSQDLKITKIIEDKIGQKVTFSYQNQTYQFELNIKGHFQAQNALCALANILAINKLNPEEIEKLLKKFAELKPAEGRMQKIATLKNNAQIFIDFAHSPDSLENTLKLAKNLTKTKIIILFGCGGDRDPKKRPLMGKIASKYADKIIITDDNPRTEDPAKIRQEILKSCDSKKTIEISGRKEAIEKSITFLKPNDILILAGKGHEKYQIIGTKKMPFNEEKIVKNNLTII